MSSTRPQTLHISRSFSRMEPPAAPASPRKRASTLQDAGIPAVPAARRIDSSSELMGKKRVADVFEINEDDEHVEDDEKQAGPELKLPSSFDELPIEIRSLSERFLESLSAKVHPTPLNAENLSELFQDFYDRAASHIATHIASLASRIGREKSPGSQGGSSRASLKGRTRAGSGAKVPSSDDLAGLEGGEMLTASEVADRKKARRVLELKRVALEEAVERGVCEKVYEKIWKHRSTDDDARDEKLRSRTAALALVGIGLKELHTDQDPAKADVRKTAAEKEDEIHQSLALAREALQRMGDERYPRGKLQHLTAAHKSIVETLSQLFPSSSSADEILPTLIYTLITSPPEGINVVSNLNFIQRFRSSSKVDGEAAYCLVNLEAAISFLETVDLSSLRADELPQGPPKSSSRPSTPTTEKSQPSMRPGVVRTLTPGVSPITVTSTEQSTPDTAAKPLPSPGTAGSSARPMMPHRRISSMMQVQAERIEAGRENFLNTADKIYDSMNGTLDNSFQFVFGRFKEQLAGRDSALPKTLEDARKLVSPSTSAEDDEALSISGRSSPAIDDPLNSSGRNDTKVLELVGGRKSLRDHSVDSTRSGGSGKRVAFTDFAGKEKAKDDAQAASAAAAAAGNLFTTINPLNRFGMPAFPRFGRGSASGSPSPGAQQLSMPPAPDSGARRTSGPTDGVRAPSAPSGSGRAESMSGQETNAAAAARSEGGEDDLNSREALAGLRKLKPPKKRFLELQSANDLKIGEVEELLLEYRRLAKAIGQAIAN